MNEHPASQIDPEAAFDAHRVPGARAVVRRRHRLSDRKQRYIELRSEGKRPMEAGVMCGLSPATARQMTAKWEHEPEVIDAIAEAEEMAGTKVGVHPTDILRELMVIGFSTLDDYEIDEDGHVSLAEDAPASAIRAIRSMKRRIAYDKDGNRTITTEIALWDKPGALAKLGESLGMWLKRLRIEEDGEVKAALSAMRDVMLKAAGRSQLHAAEEAEIARFQGTEAPVTEHALDRFRALARGGE